MNLQPRPMFRLLFIVALLVCSGASASEQSREAPDTAAMTLSFRGADYLHRWSSNHQNEFTPRGEADLEKWRDMITINVNEKVGNGDQLARFANAVLANYKRHGKVLRTNSIPRTETRPAEHFIVAILGNRALLEAAFARFVMVDGVGFVIVYSHRVYGDRVGPEMSAWLKANGPDVEKTLMAWDKMPTLASLRQLPQAK